MNKFWLIMLSCTFFNFVASAGPGSATVVGNGDDGSDIELLQPVTSGRLIKTRDMALKKINDLRSQDLPHLGYLRAEIEKSRIFMAEKNVASQFKFDQGLESSENGSLVYARTFAEHHADTRFFPAALQLPNEQLVVLHIHEGLHRALPPSVRQNEEIVAKITLAITAKDASFDRVRNTIEKLIPNRPSPAIQQSRAPIESKEKISKIKLGYRFFDQPKNTGFQTLKSTVDFKAMLYPIENKKHRVGVGFHFIVFNVNDNSILGPINLEIDYLYSFYKNFRVGLFANGSFSTLSEEEQRKYAGIRDISSFGLQSLYSSKRWEFKNRLSFSESWSLKEKFGPSTYEYDFPTLTKVNMQIGYRYAKIFTALHGEIVWSSPYTIIGPGFDYDSGQYRLVTLGPKFQYDFKNFSLEAEYRTVINATSGIDLDYLGDIFGSGVGLGYYGVGISHRF